MTGRQRLLAALQFQPVDELPVLLKGLEPCSPMWAYRDESWDPVFERYVDTGDSTAIIAPTIQRETVPWPPGAVSGKEGPVRSHSRCLVRTDKYEDWETTFQTPAGQLTQVRRNLYLTEAIVKPAVESPADLPAARWLLSQPVEVDEDATRSRFDDLSRWPHTLPLLGVREPIDYVVELIGAEQFAFFLIEAADELAELVEIAAEPVMRKLEAALRTGIRPVIWVDGGEWVTPPYAGPDRFRELVFPYLRQIVEVAHGFGCPVLSHCHGKIAAVLDQFLEAGIDATHPFEAPPMGDITPKQLKARTGRRLCYVGNIQLDDMLRAPRGEIQRQVEELLTVFSDWPEGGFVLSVTGTPTCREAPAQAIENYLYLLECKNS